MQRRQAWEILYDLSSFTRASFDAVKLLRSQRLVDDEVYAIIRLSFCLEEPLKTNCSQEYCNGDKPILCNLSRRACPQDCNCES